MKKFTGIKKKEQEIFDSLRQIVVFDEESHIDQVPVVFGGYEIVESLILNDDRNGFFTQVASDVEDMLLPVIGITTAEIGSNHVKMKGTIFCATHEDLNQIVEQIYNTVNLNDNISAGNVRIGKKNVNRCSLLTGDFDIQFDG